MANVGSPFENSCILLSIGVVAIIINSTVITKYGRRRVFMTTGLTVCGIAQLIVAAVYAAQPGTETTGKVIVGLSIIYLAGYNGCLSSYSWVTGGEIPSQRLRSYTFGLATAIGFLGAVCYHPHTTVSWPMLTYIMQWLTTFTAPYFINPDALNWGPKYGFIWAPICFITAAWVYFYLPELKDRTLEEIDELVSLHHTILSS